jgi:phosphoserine phosphatase
VVFDLDHTLIRGNSSFLYYRYLFQLGVFPWWSLVFAIWYFFLFSFFLLSPKELHQKVFSRFLKGKKAQNFISHAPKFWKKYKNKLFFPAYQKLREHKKNHDFILLLSSSPSFVVDPISKMIQVDEYQSAEYTINREGNFQKIAFSMQGKDKEEIVRKLRKDPSQRIVVYTDSIWDKDLLFLADEAICVRPDRKLARLAKKQHWKIL